MANKLKWVLFGLLLFSAIGLLLLGAPGANAAGPIVALPSFPVRATFDWVGNHYSGTVLSGVGAGYDVHDNVPYTGWCAEYTSTGDPGTPNTTFTVTLYSTYDPSLPVNLTKWGSRTIPWDQINYALNHRTGYSFTDVETTIFRLIDGAPSTLPLYLDAVANGSGFVPGPGQIVAVILTNGSGINSGFNDHWQENIIEVPVPGVTAVQLSSFSSAGLSADPLMGVGIPGLLLGVFGVVVGLGLSKRRALTN